MPKIKHYALFNNQNIDKPEIPYPYASDNIPFLISCKHFMIRWFTDNVSNISLCQCYKKSRKNKIP